MNTPLIRPLKRARASALAIATIAALLATSAVGTSIASAEPTVGVETELPGETATDTPVPTPDQSPTTDEANTSAEDPQPEPLAVPSSSEEATVSEPTAPADAPLPPAAASARTGKTVGPVSGLTYSWNPADHAVPTDGEEFAWGGEGGKKSGDDYTLNWFYNYTNKNVVITQLQVNMTGGFGKMNNSICKLPMTIPAHGYATCEIKYTGDARDPKYVDFEYVFFTSSGEEFDGIFSVLKKSGGTPAPKGPFWDVPANHKFVKPITWMKKTGLSTGNADGSYRPGSKLTRGAMAAFMYRQAGKPAFKMPKTRFKDVGPSHKFYKPIMWMKATGLSTGNADGTYRPSASLSRGAMAAFMYRQAGRPSSVPSKQYFWDVKKNHKFYKAITWMRSTKITSGNSDGSYRPNSPVTRQAMAAFLYRKAGSPKV